MFQLTPKNIRFSASSIDSSKLLLICSFICFCLLLTESETVRNMTSYCLPLQRNATGSCLRQITAKWSIQIQVWKSDWILALALTLAAFHVLSCPALLYLLSSLPFSPFSFFFLFYSSDCFRVHYNYPNRNGNNKALHICQMTCLLWFSVQFYSILSALSFQIMTAFLQGMCLYLLRKELHYFWVLPQPKLLSSSYFSK